MNQKEELQLIQKAKKGNDEAFTELFKHHYSFLYKYLLKVCFNPQLTEDLLQETMLKAYVHLPTFKGEAKFSTWLISIASRTYMDYLRKEKRERKRLEKIQDEALRKLKWHLATNGHEWTEQMTLIAKVDPQIRVSLLLRHYYGYTYEEIAQMLQIKVGTVKSRVHNGIKSIRKEWSR